MNVMSLSVQDGIWYTGVRSPQASWEIRLTCETVACAGVDERTHTRTLQETEGVLARCLHVASVCH